MTLARRHKDTKTQRHRKQRILTWWQATAPSCEIAQRCSRTCRSGTRPPGKNIAIIFYRHLEQQTSAKFCLWSFIHHHHQVLSHFGEILTFWANDQSVKQQVHRHIIQARKKYTKTCVNSRQNSLNRSKCANILGSLYTKKYTGWNIRTPRPVVTYMSYGNSFPLLESWFV